jgi:hypothetical protein
LIIIACVAIASSATLADESHQLSEQIDVPKGRDNAPDFEICDLVEVQGQIYADEFFGDSVINANPTVKNTGKKSFRVDVHIAFFDENQNLIGCVSQGSEVKPGKEKSFGSCLVRVPEDAINEVEAYKVMVYLHKTGESSSALLDVRRPNRERQRGRKLVLKEKPRKKQLQQNPHAGPGICNPWTGRIYRSET